MSHKVIFQSIYDPSVPGYPDKVAIFDDADTVIFHAPTSCCPNHRGPRKAGYTGADTPWDKLYGWLACGEYEYLCCEHNKYGKCLILNLGNRVPSRVPNPQHDGEMYLEGVFVHAGYDKELRGSMGCLTLPKELFGAFMSCFELGDTGKLAVIDYSRKVA